MTTTTPPSPTALEPTISCVAVLQSRHVNVRICGHDSVESLVDLVRAKFQAKYPSEDFNEQIEGLWSRRLEKDLFLEVSVDEVIQDEDILEVRPYTVAPPSAVVAALNSDSSSAKYRARSLSVGSVRLGIFTVTVLRAEKLPIPVLIRTARASLMLRLLPYDHEETTAASAGPEYSWPKPVTLRHRDPTRHNLVLYIQVFDNPSLGIKVPVATAFASVKAAVEAPGTTVQQWVHVKNLDEHAMEIEGGRLLISTCFHPKVTKGPTVHNLLRELQPAENSSSLSKPGDLRKHGSVRFFTPAINDTQGNIQAAIQQKSTKHVKGVFTVCLRGIHVCGAQCSKLDGHSTISYPDFAPIVRITFGDDVQELHLGATECDAAFYEHEWTVQSIFSQVRVEILRKVTLTTGTVQLLADGSSAVKVCELSLSCHDLQEFNAASWTLDPPGVTLGPGKNPPKDGFQWYAFTHGDEEIGLANMRVRYKENFLALFNPKEDPDMSYVYPDERSFDPAIIQRNIERLDEAFSIFVSMRKSVQDILDWKRPYKTFCIWLSIIICCCCPPPAHLPFFPPAIVVVTLIVNYGYFLSGYTHKKWIYHVHGKSSMKAFRPVATLRVVPVRATGLKAIDGCSSVHPASFVRIYYEPNYKNIPVHLIAQTECARNADPNWAVPQKGSKEDFHGINNRSLRDIFRHLGSHAQDAVLHDVVEPWPRADGQVDTHAFKYPMLQPVEVREGTHEEDLIPWDNCPGAIRFDVICESSGGLLGRARVPITTLISNERRGGLQQELEETLPLATPSKIGGKSSGMQVQVDDLDVPSDPATLTVRMQLKLRDPCARVTLKESLASEAMYDVMEMEHEKELSFVEKYHRAKDVAKNIQETLGRICSTLERIKNLFLWVHPKKTLFVLVMAIFASICCYFIPLKYIIMYGATKAFSAKFHRAKNDEFIRFQNFLCTIPTDLDMKKIYYWKNQEFLRIKEHTEAQAKLQADWSGYIMRHGETLFNSWQERYCAMRGGRLEFWQSIADAKSGAPPKSCLIVSNVVDKCTTSETAQIPKDTYPLVVFDLSRQIISSSRKRRHVLCTKSEEECRILAEIIRTTGEQMQPAAAVSQRPS